MNNMKIYKLFVSMMLMGIVACFSSCSDDENVYYYSFKNIEYTVSAGDGLTSYETNWEVLQSIVNGSGDKEVQAGPGDIYQGYHEYYTFKCDNPGKFNPTVGHVHVPIPQTLVSGSQIVLDEKEGEFSMEENEVIRSYEERKFNIPAKTKLVLERKVEMRKLELTYKATFKCHPSGSDYVVTGKFLRYTPVGISLVEKYEPVK
jgi:hypothetical protein